MKNTLKEALRWFLQAKDDWLFVQWIHREGVFFDKGCFMAQQAGEKALKACLYGLGERYVLGHSLFELMEKLKEFDPSFGEIADAGRRLDRFYIPTRYPNGLPGGSPFQVFTAEDLRQALLDAGTILDLCARFLKRQGLPSL
uniref:HEPN domain-containing protein n=1 Tax=Desulfacinum infernum TaxID=35837 RepID=A0A832EJR3_9BACT